MVSKRYPSESITDHFEYDPRTGLIFRKRASLEFHLAQKTERFEALQKANAFRRAYSSYLNTNADGSWRPGSTPVDMFDCGRVTIDHIAIALHTGKPLREVMHKGIVHRNLDPFDLRPSNLTEVDRKSEWASFTKKMISPRVPKFGRRLGVTAHNDYWLVSLPKEGAKIERFTTQEEALAAYIKAVNDMDGRPALPPPPKSEPISIMAILKVKEGCEDLPYG